MKDFDNLLVEVQAVLADYLIQGRSNRKLPNKEREKSWEELSSHIKFLDGITEAAKTYTFEK